MVIRRKKMKHAGLITGALLTGAVAGLTPVSANTSGLFNYSSLGSGSEIRGELLDMNVDAVNAYELKCGEGKCGEEKKKEQKTTEKKAEKKGKATEMKCGEGKCGEEKKAEKKKKEKTTEQKCGEGKCGA